MRKIKNKIRNKVKMKQGLSVLLCSMLLVSGFPNTAFAEEIPEFTGEAESSFEDGSSLALFGDGTAENVQEETGEFVQEQINALSTVEELQAMPPEKQQEVYEQLQTTYEAYTALTDEQKDTITGAEIFESLFAMFNSMVALAAEKAGPFQITVNDGNTAETPYTYTTASDNWCPSFLTVNDGADITISNTDSTKSPTTHIVIAENATVTITLKGVNITGIQEDSHNGETVPSPIDLSSGATLTLILAEGSTNTLTGGAGTSSRGSPGIHVPDNATLIIQGGGSLSVTGGTYISGYGAPGIGGRTDVSESDHNNFCGENCGTVIILPGGSVKAIGGTGSGGHPAADIGGGRGDPDGDDGQGIKPTGNGTYAVFGDLTLPCDITIPEGATVVIPKGASLTVPEGKTLTNNGTLLVQGGRLFGNATGNQPAYPSEVTVAFSKDGQSVTSVPYGSTITVTATMEKADSAANTLRANTGTVDFYLGTAEDGTKLNQDGVSVTQGPDGTYTAALNVTLDGEKWKPGDSPYTITADFGGYVPGGAQGGDSLAPNAGSAQLTVTKAQQAAPTGGFSTTSRTDSSITLHFTDSSQSENGNGLEFAYAEGVTADTPTSTWTTASPIGTTAVYSATVGQLSHGTPYVFFVRYKEDAYHEPSPVVVNNRFLYTKPKITTESLPNAYVGEPYSYQLQALAADGVAVRWSITRGSLPDGLTLSSDGTISGTPTTVTPQAVSLNISAALGDPDVDFTQNEKSWIISVTKSDAELENLTVSGSTGIPEGTFQYGDTINVTFTPRRQASAAADTLTPDTATLTYTPDGGEPRQLATASVQADGSFTLIYDTKQKMLPIKANLPLTISYGGSSVLNPVTETVFVTHQKGMLRNRPSISGSYAYGGTLTVDYIKQDDEMVSYQWLRSDSTGYTEIDGANNTAYTLTEEDIGKHIYVEITPAYNDEWHTGLLQSAPQVVTKAPQTAPSAPSAAGTTTYSVTLNTIPANANGAAAEYGISKDGGKIWTWQSDPEFTGLSSNTTYQFAARYGETDKYMTSDPSAPVNIATDRYSSWDPPVIRSVSVSPKQLTLEKGSSRQFTAEVEGSGSYNQEVVWSVSGQTSSQTVIGEDGILTIGKEENASVLTVTAAAAGDREKSDTAIVTVVDLPIPAVEISKVLIKGNQAKVLLSGEAEGATGYDFVIGKDRDCIQTKEYYKVNKNVLTTDTTFYYVEQGTYYAYCHAWRRVDGKKEFGDWSVPYKFTVKAVTPEQPKITGIRVSKNTVKITYTRSEGATGYDLVLGKAVKKVNGELRPVDYGELVKKVYKGNTVTATFKNVEKGTYYAGLHAYNRTSEDGKKVFSLWSKAKKIRVR